MVHDDDHGSDGDGDGDGDGDINSIIDKSNVIESLD